MPDMNDPFVAVRLLLCASAGRAERPGRRVVRRAARPSGRRGGPGEGIAWRPALEELPAGRRDV